MSQKMFKLNSKMFTNDNQGYEQMFGTDNAQGEVCCVDKKFFKGKTLPSETVGQAAGTIWPEICCDEER